MAFITGRLNPARLPAQPELDWSERASIPKRQQAEAGFPRFHRDQGTTLQILAVPLQQALDRFADESGPHIVQSQLNHAREFRAGLEEQLAEIQVVRTTAA
jgi:hypothetical protein